MIISDLYADGVTYTTTGDRVNKFSVFAGQTPDYPSVDTSPYYLGWIKPENLPMQAGSCIGENLGDGAYKFTNNTDKENFPIGYALIPSSGSSYKNFMQDDEITDGFYQVRFVNQLYPMYCAQSLSSESYSLGFFGFIYDSNDNYLSKNIYSISTVNGAAFNSGNLKQLFRMFNNPDYEYVINLGTTYGTVTFTGNEWEEGTFYKETSTGYHARFFFTQFYMPPNMYIQTQSSTFRLYLAPFTRYTYNSGAHSRHKFLNNVGAGTYNINTVAEISQSGASLEWWTGNRVGLSGTVNVSMLNSTNPYTFDGNVLAAFANDRSKILFLPIYKLSDFRKSVSLFFRLDTDPRTNSYVLGTTWATNVTENDEFLAELKTGDFADIAFKNSLRQWQYEDFQTNDFTEEDIPAPTPPTPPRPEPVPPGEDENGGDDILSPDTLGVGATMGFVTQYCLNASQISELGAQLWTSFTDPDYWKNFMFSLALDTGSFNTSALLDYFVSLRVYPFPLLNVPSYAAWGQDMYVGTGVVPLHFTTSLHYINTFADWVDAGSCSIPFTFGDFRDYNQEITLYLPFCGTVQLEPADVLGGTISAKYAVDFSSGACTAVVMIETWDGHNYPIAILPGQIGADVPLTATTAGQVAARLGSDVLNVAGILLDGAKGAAGAVAPMVAGAVTENPAMIATGAAQMAGNNVNTVAGLAGQALNMATRPGIGAPMLSGGRGFSSFGCPQKCYVQIRRPFYDTPTNYESTEGHPAAEQVTVSSCQGLARFVNPNVASIEAMEEEKEEIRRRLATGVIV